MNRGLAGLALAPQLLPGTAGAQLEAVRIDSRNVEHLQIGGPDAVGGVGDWYLGNDLVEVMLSTAGLSAASPVLLGVLQRGLRCSSA